MDAGLAAVLGALAGSAATIGAAMAAGWSAREQSKMAARSEHLRQRRDARQAVYEEFINAANAHADLTKLLLAPVPQEYDDFERMRLLPRGMDWASVVRNDKAMFESISKISTRVQLAGPKSVSTAAAKVEETAQDVSVSISLMTLETDIPGMPSLADRWQEGAVKYCDYSDAVESFFELARIALDDDGTK
ncbi:hypothetical protein ACIRPS_24920 [Streptomyces griseoviridis]